MSAASSFSMVVPLARVIGSPPDQPALSRAALPGQAPTCNDAPAGCGSEAVIANGRYVKKRDGGRPVPGEARPRPHGRPRAILAAPAATPQQGTNGGPIIAGEGHPTSVVDSATIEGSARARVGDQGSYFLGAEVRKRLARARVGSGGNAGRHFRPIDGWPGRGRVGVDRVARLAVGPGA